MQDGQDLRGWTIAFDLDGTLVDTAPDLVLATHHALATLGAPPVAQRHILPWVSFGARRMITESLAVLGRAESEPTVDRALNDFLVHYAANIAVESRPFPGAVQALDDLARRGARLAVCTNKRQDLSLALLDALGLSRRFAAIVGRDAVPRSKPHPDHLLAAIARAGGSPHRAVMVGDSEVDIETAQSARVPVVAVTFGYPGRPVADCAPDAIIDHYDALVAATVRLAARSA